MVGTLEGMTRQERSEYYRQRYLRYKSKNGGRVPQKPVQIVNVDDFKDESGFWVKCKTTNQTQARTLSYNVWKRIRSRCNPASAYHKKGDWYVGCSMDERFQDFQYFVEWHRAQVGYGLGYDVDKDFLVLGNKVYGPDTCLLLPSGLNCFAVRHTKNDGLPQGVWVCTRKGQYKVEIKVMGSRAIHVGRFSNVAEARRAYIDAKCAMAELWIERIQEESLVVDTRVVDILSNWRARYEQD